jgi:hypothetical protein
MKPAKYCLSAPLYLGTSWSMRERGAVYNHLRLPRSSSPHPAARTLRLNPYLRHALRAVRDVTSVARFRSILVNFDSINSLLFCDRPRPPRSYLRCG